MWKVLADKDYRIGKIKVVVEEVFASDEPDYGRWYAEAANAIHFKTRQSVIHSLLLFRDGDPVNPRVIYQTLRRLRAQPYLRSARITPTACHDDRTVAVTVRVNDAWTLKVSGQFSHVGGGNFFNFSFEQSNLLGLGKEVQISQKGDIERSGYLLLYRDPALAGSRWQLFTEYQRLSDGFSKTFDIGRPFHEDTDPWATAFHFLDQKTDLGFHNRTRQAWRASDSVREFQWSGARLLSFSDYTGYRLGLSYSYTDYEYGPLRGEEPGLLPPPELTPRTLAGVALTWQMFQDRYASYHNLQHIGRAEDYNLGWNLGASLGYYATALGSTEPGWYGSLEVSNGVELPYSSVALVAAAVRARRGSGDLQNLLASTTFSLYNQYFSYQTLVANLNLDGRLRPDPENFLYLGGVGGLRGYPNFLRIGDQRWTLVVSDRVVTPWKIGTFFQLGFVAYFEAGQIHQLSPSAWSRLYSDVGVGLRVGNLKGSSGQVISLTVAKPLVRGPEISSYEIVVGTVVTF